MANGKQQILRAKMPKKAILTLEFLIQITIFAIVLILIIIPIGIRLFDFFTAKPKPATLNSLDMLSIKIKYLEGEEIIPVYVDDKHIIQGFDERASGKPANCDKSSCLCVCKKEGCTGNQIIKCSKLESEYSNENIKIPNSIIIMPTEKITNFLVSLNDNKLTIEKREGLGI
jgi:hypothetical protein